MSTNLSLTAFMKSDVHKSVYSKRWNSDEPNYHTLHKLRIINRPKCYRQNERLHLIISAAHLARSFIAFPVGLFFDYYGTIRTRFLAVLLFTTSCLLMTFTSPGLPWLIIPAICLISLSGNLVLITSLQIANLFADHRSLLISLFVGAHESGSLVSYFMTLSYRDTINFQTSFMFFTISIVPLLVSAIAFLPKYKIPWPLPSCYGKKLTNNEDLSNNLVYVSDQYNTKRINIEYSFISIACRSLMLGALMWQAANSSLASHLYNTIYDRVYLSTNSSIKAESTVEYNYYIQFGAILISIPYGILLDRRISSTIGSEERNKLSIQNVLIGIILTSGLSVVIAILSTLSLKTAQFIVTPLAFCARVFSHITSIAILSHVCFPQSLFGRLYGLMVFMMGMADAAQFVFRKVSHTFFNSSPFAISAIHVVLVVVVSIHPANVWRQMKSRLLYNRNTSELETHLRPASFSTDCLSRQLIERRPTDCKPIIPEDLIPASQNAETKTQTLPAETFANFLSAELNPKTFNRTDIDGSQISTCDSRV